MSLFAAPFRSPGTSSCFKKVARSTSKLWRPQEAWGEKRFEKRGVAHRRSRHLGYTTEKTRKDTEHSFENAFIDALVATSACRYHAALSPALGNESMPRSLANQRFHGTGRRNFSISSISHETRLPAIVWRNEEPSTRPITAEEYKRLVNTYDTNDTHLELPERRQPLAPRLFMTAEQEDRSAPRTILPPIDEQHAQALQDFSSKLYAYKPGYVNLVAMWKLWQRLPSPRVRYVDDSVLWYLFRHLAAVEFKDLEGAKERYYSLLEECVGERVSLMREQWNTAIAFAGRQSRPKTAEDVRNAVEMWMRMEDSGKKANNVTFNILFDVAVKAGRYALAETILDELHSRRLPMNRFLRTGLIYYAGVRGDGDSVRRAFNELVEADEIVDTAVMNAVIASLIRAGEAPAAENVFGKMKQLYESKEGSGAVRTWQKQREMGALLNDTARGLREEKQAHERSFFGGVFSSDNRKEAVQKAAPIAPNASTYRILIKYQCYTGGDLDRVQALLREMTEQQFPIHGSIYTNIMRGFQLHGGYAFSTWRRPQLEMYWQEFLQAEAAGREARKGREDRHIVPTEMTTQSTVHSDGASDLTDYADDTEFWTAHTSEANDIESDVMESGISADASRSLEPSENLDLTPEISEEFRAPYFTRALAKATLRSFYQCAGAKRMLEVWEEIKGRWKDISTEDRDNLQHSVNWMYNQDRSMEADGSWESQRPKQ